MISSDGFSSPCRPTPSEEAFRFSAFVFFVSCFVGVFCCWHVIFNIPMCEMPFYFLFDVCKL